MKLINITTLLVAAAISHLSSAAVSNNERSDEVNLLIKNLRHLGTGEKPVKGDTSTKKEKKLKGDGADMKEKLPPKVKGDSDKKKEKGVKGESSGKEEKEGPSSKAPKTYEPKEKESKTKKPSEMFPSDYPSNLMSDVPTEVPV